MEELVTKFSLKAYQDKIVSNGYYFEDLMQESESRIRKLGENCGMKSGEMYVEKFCTRSDSNIIWTSHDQDPTFVSGFPLCLDLLEHVC